MTSAALPSVSSHPSYSAATPDGDHPHRLLREVLPLCQEPVRGRWLAAVPPCWSAVMMAMVQPRRLRFVPRCRRYQRRQRACAAKQAARTWSVQAYRASELTVEAPLACDEWLVSVVVTWSAGLGRLHTWVLQLQQPRMVASEGTLADDGTALSWQSHQESGTRPHMPATYVTVGWLSAANARESVGWDLRRESNADVVLRERRKMSSEVSSSLRRRSQLRGRDMASFTSSTTWVSQPQRESCRQRPPPHVKQCSWPSGCASCCCCC